MINLGNTLLPNDKAHATAADICKLIKPNPLIHKIKEVNVAPIITIVSMVFKIVLRVLQLLNFFSDSLFLSLKKQSPL